MTNAQFFAAVTMAAINILRWIENLILAGTTMDELLKLVQAKIKELSSTSNLC